MEDVIHFREKRMDDVMPGQLEIRMGKQMPHIVFAARKKIVNTQHIRIPSDQRIAQMAAQKTGAAGHQHMINIVVHRYIPLTACEAR